MQYDSILENQPDQLSCTRGSSHSIMKTLMEIKKKKRVLLEDESLDWLQIWMTASSLDVKSKKGISFILLTGWFFQIYGHMSNES